MSRDRPSNSPFLIDLEKERAQWNTGKEPGDQTAAMRHQLEYGNPTMNFQDYYVIYREETPNEIQARMSVDPDEMDPNSYHSAVLRSPENQRWVTAMDIAIGQAHSLDDPAMREVLVAIADWKLDQETFMEITQLPGWAKLSEEAQALVTASFRYNDKGLFPPSGLVSLAPPPLLADVPELVVGR